MVLALSTGQALGLAGAAAAFILFALISAFVLPRRDPNFPGRRLPLFLAVTVLFFVGMMAAVLVLAREESEDAEHDAEAPAQTEPAPSAEGDPAAGERVFASAGCGSCHALEAAGSRGTVGPDLDSAAPGFDRAVQQVTNGGPNMPAFGDRLSDEEIRDVAAFVVASTR